MDMRGNLWTQNKNKTMEFKTKQQHSVGKGGLDTT